MNQSNINRKLQRQIRLTQLSKYNHCTLNSFPNIFQCSKCKKYTNVTTMDKNVQYCSYCNNPCYVHIS